MGTHRLRKVEANSGKRGPIPGSAQICEAISSYKALGDLQVSVFWEEMMGVWQGETTTVSRASGQSRIQVGKGRAAATEG